MKAETTRRCWPAAGARAAAIQVGTDMLFELIPAYLEFFGFGTATPDELRDGGAAAGMSEPSAPREPAAPPATHRVVVIGGGFGGLSAVRALAHADVDITVVDRTNHHLFQPLLYQVAAGILPPGLIAPALRAVIKKQPNARALLAEVTDLDLQRRVVTAEGPDGRMLALPYDTLVVAAGATHSYFGRDELAGYAPGMKTIEDARHLRDHILVAFEMAELSTDAKERAEWLTFVVIGAGPTGVELVGQVAEFAAPGAARGLPHRQHDGGADPAARGRGGRARPVPGEAAEVLAGEAGVDGRRGAPEHPGDRDGRGQHHGQGPGRGGDDPHPHQDLGGGREGVPAGEAARRARRGSRPTARGGSPCKPDCTLEGHPEVFAVGDMVSLNKLPGIAQPALQEGKYVGKLIASRLAGDEKAEPFKYFDKGSMATIGHRSAIAESFGMKFTGVLGYTMWGAIHVLYLIGWGNRLGTLYTWGRALTFSRNRGHRIITFQQAHDRAEETRDIPGGHGGGGHGERRARRCAAIRIGPLTSPYPE